MRTFDLKICYKIYQCKKSCDPKKGLVFFIQIVIYYLSLFDLEIKCGLDTLIMRLTLLVSRHGTVPAGILAATHHLLDPMEALPVKTERLFKQHLVLHRPLVREGGEVGEISE